MILSVSSTETNCNLESRAFSIKASPLAFEILSSRLYTNPIRAVIRELMTNAYDSQVLNGNPDNPIDVHIPDQLDSSFSIRDYGVGLSKEDVTELYTTFFSSTKRESNDFTGCFGLGSKSPFAYSQSFSITSFFNGTRYDFLAVKKDGYPSVIAVREVPTDDPNGLKVSLPVRNSDIPAFANEFANYTSIVPELVVHCNKALMVNKRIYSRDGLTAYHVENTSNRSLNSMGLLIKQGQNLFPVNLNNTDSKLTRIVERLRYNYVLVFEVPLGTFDIVPSREQLLMDDTGTRKLNELSEKILPKIYEFVHDTVYGREDKVPSHFLGLYVDMLYEKYDFSSYDIVCYTQSRMRDTAILSVMIRMVSLFKIHNTDGSYSLSTANSYLDFSIDAKKIILIVPRNFSTKSMNNIYNTIKAYDNLVDTTFYLFFQNNRNYNIVSTLSMSSLLSKMRTLHKAVKVLNSMEERYCNITIMTLNQFYRKYPDKVKIQHTGKSGNRIVQCLKNSRMSIYKANKPNARTSGFVSYQARSETALRNDYPSLKTIIIPYSKYYSDAYIEQFFISMYGIRDVNGNYVMVDYLKKKLPFIDNNKDLMDIYILRIANKHVSKFKDYVTIPMERLIAEICSYDWRLIEINHSLLNSLLDGKEPKSVKTLIDNFIANNRSKWRTLKDSVLYRKCMVLLSILDKYNYRREFLNNDEDWITSKLVHVNIERFITNDMYMFLHRITSTPARDYGNLYVPLINGYGQESIRNIIRKGYKPCTTF